MIAFIDEHRGTYGVEPICRVLPAKSQDDLREIAPSTYHEHKARQADSSRVPPRAQRDTALRAEIKRVFDANFRVYGACKAWRQLRRERVDVARCTVARLKDMEPAGVMSLAVVREAAIAAVPGGVGLLRLPPTRGPPR